MILMVEQSHAGEGHDDTVLVALFDDQVITDGAAGLGNVLDAGSHATLDGVGKGEECVGAQGYGITGIQPCTLFFGSQRLGTDGEVVLPDALGANVLFVAVDVAVDDVVTAGATQVGTERQIQGLGMLTQEPGVSLAACQTDTVDTGLLTCAHTDGLAVIGKADRIGLGVLQGDQGDDQIDLGGLGQFLVGGNDVLQQVLADLEVVPALLEGNAEDLLMFLLSRDIVGVDLDTL